MKYHYFRNKQIFVISPHLDDALLSTGMLLTSLQPYSDITVISIFTKGTPGPYTLSARKFISTSGCNDAVTLFEKRKLEDKKALAKIGAKHVYLEFEDALFRKKASQSLWGKILPEFSHLYPIYRFNILGNAISSRDTAPDQLKQVLKKYIPPQAIVLSPLGIGNHVDHTITRFVCTELFPQVVYYADFPYTIRNNIFGIPPFGYKLVEFPVDIKKKQTLINCYASQVQGLFPNGKIPPHTELLFVPEKWL
ncbi:PIG-L family deacetylase [Candidatus Roizmanbacteria bacterium]|nr:PIG-L family deacetylase [Candidatus Roizmanbacteria bacterium]